MRILIIFLFVSAACFGNDKQTVFSSADDTWTLTGSNTYLFYGKYFLPVGRVPHNIPFDTIPKSTTMDTLKAPLISILEVLDFLSAINKKIAAMKELELIKDAEYNSLRSELNKIVAVLEKKKKTFK